MNREKQKKLLEFIKSNTFCNGFLIFCSLIGAGISLDEGINMINLLGFPIAFTVGMNGLIFIPMICDKKIAELEKKDLKEISKEEVEEKTPELEIVKRTNNSQDLINIIDNILLANSNIGVKMELLPEWQEYLEDTFLDPKGIKIIQELIYYLMLLNSLPIEKFIPLLKGKEDLLDLLIHFSNNGKYLAKALNKEVKEMKREKTI